MMLEQGLDLAGKALPPIPGVTDPATLAARAISGATASACGSAC